MRLKMFAPLLSAVVLGLSATALAPMNTVIASADAQASTPIPACPGAPAAHLVIGEFARVTPGTPDNVRSKPTKSGEQVTQIAPGQSVLITGGPTCSDSYLWWPVYTETGFEGWVAEGIPATYFLDPSTAALTHYAVSAGADSTLTYDKFGLVYPAALAKELSTHVSATTVLSFGGIPNTSATPQPEHVDFLFGALSARNMFSYASLSIYKTDAVNQLGGSGAQVIVSLRNLIGNQAAIAQGTPIQGYPPLTAGQLFHARTGYLKFKGGSGIRFVPYYAQAVDVIHADRLQYTFLGLSDDGQYYIIATIPVSTAALVGDKSAPNMSDPSIATSYPPYVSQVVAKLEQANPADFAPDLAALDALMQSIAVK